MKKTDSIRDILKNARHRKPTMIFCPRCASPKIRLNSSLDVWLTPKTYYCEDCGYHGILVMELEPENEEAQKGQDETSKKA
jgi:transcription elongation factor Elf1